MQKQICTSNDIKKLGSILSVWAHPDDESFFCAGIMAAAVDNGQSVACITATKGEAGSQDHKKWPVKSMGRVRSKELKEALDCLGVNDHHWMGYKDGTLQGLDAGEPVAQLVALIEQHQPDTILTFGNDGITGHTDHITVSKWVDLAVEAYGKLVKVYQASETKQKYEKYFRDADKRLNIYFNTDKPKLCDEATCDIRFTLDKDLCDKKYQAFASMPSQTTGLLSYFTPEEFAEAFCSETFKKAQ
jgi:LmbE family N-acetylglucosaminyl deacetylase